MKHAILILTLLTTAILTCDQNCYLGAGLYGAPLDNKGCCKQILDPFCYSYVAIGEGRFICRQCQLEYKWDNDKCVKYAKSDICVNPDIVSTDFVICKVCRITSELHAPVETNTNNKKVVACQPVSSESKIGQSLQNCLASALHNGMVFCHQCEDGYFYDGLAEKCQLQNKCKTLNGCLLSFVENKCDLCRQSYQYDIRTYSCISKTVVIDYEQFRKDTLLKMQNQVITEQRLRADPNMAGFVSGFGGSPQTGSTPQNYQAQSYLPQMSQEYQPQMTQGYQTGQGQNFRAQGTGRYQAQMAF